ncbi:FliG C-terminal domain-containing protein [Henriciella marina]|uniref:FliG C-terminal domain-containing protein n=1 Tax=Henriciella marina TaxID=453851 RepID=UPI00037CE8B3|nr:FliG C-terminal domain-containing protein [Henriciella marina]
MKDAVKKPASNVTPLRPRGQGNGKLQGVPPARRAAVVIAMLGEQAARPIVEKLDDDALAQVAAELEAVSYLGREELTDIVMDFLQALRQTNGSFRGGKARAKEIVSGFLDESRIDHVFGNGGIAKPKPMSQSSDVWTRLEEKKPSIVADYLSGLTANISAIILRKLDVSFASEVVGHLQEPMLDSTIGYLVSGEQVDAEIEAVVAQMVEIEFLNQVQEVQPDESANAESVGELLSLLPNHQRARIMSFIRTEYEDKFESIEKVMFTIEGLPEILPRQSVPVVFRELGEETLVPVLSTLTGSAQRVQDYLLENISSRLAIQYRDGLDDPNRKPVEDAEATQRSFLTTLMSMKRQGLIVMEKSKTPS